MGSRSSETCQRNILDDKVEIFMEAFSVFYVDFCLVRTAACGVCVCNCEY